MASAFVAPKRGQQTLIIDLPALYPVQQGIKRQSKRFNVLDIGRRAGKTYLGVHLAIEIAAEGWPVGWFSPSYKYMLEVWRDLIRPVKDVATKINATERRIEIEGGGLVEVWTLEDEDAGRGRKYKRAIIDEAAMAPNLKTAWEGSIRPTLTDMEGDAWFCSTPRGLNYFHELFQRGQDPLQPDWISWKMPSSVNPFLPPKEIEAARNELPQLVYQQEYLAEFLQNEGAVFRNVDACLKSRPTNPAEHRGHVVVAGVDWGRSHDFTAVSVVCATCQREIHLDRFNQIGWEFQRGRISSICQAWGVRRVRVETNSIGSPNLEALSRETPSNIGVGGFETTGKTKGPLIEALALAFEREEIQWLPDPVARQELVAYEATITESGHVKYSAPPGQWDDTVMARALARSIARPVAVTVEERIEAALPMGWRSADIAALPPVEAQRRNDARQDELKRLREEMQNKRRPQLWHSSILDDGDAHDIQ